MTFTQADHAKAVELYERFNGAEWWPVLVYDYDQGWTNWGDRVRDSIALSAIAWAMVERLGDVDLYSHADGSWETSHGPIAPTRFLALAAAVEAQ